MDTDKMRKFRDQLVEVLEAGGYTITDTGIGAFEEGKVLADIRVEDPDGGVFNISIKGE